MLDVVDYNATSNIYGSIRPLRQPSQITIERCAAARYRNPDFAEDAAS
jgi:hypothetical protein